MTFGIVNTISVGVARTAASYFAGVRMLSTTPILAKSFTALQKRFEVFKEFVKDEGFDEWRRDDEIHHSDGTIGYFIYNGVSLYCMNIFLPSSTVLLASWSAIILVG
jgi:hypothetical protein